MSLYDVAIIGGGLSGQLAAFLLSKEKYSILLCEADPKLGGKSRLDYGFNLLTPELSKTLSLDLSYIEMFNQEPLALRKMNWVSVSPEEISPEQKYFFFKDFIFPRGGIEKVFTSLNAGFSSVEIKLSTPILECAIQDHTIQKIISGKEGWQAKAVVAAIPFTGLTHMLGTDYFHPRFLKKIRKQKMVSAVKLNFILKEKVCDYQNILFSLDSNGVGFFPSNVDSTLIEGTKQISQWLFFLKEEELVDAEEVAKKIRAGKRFIQKAWPQFFNQVEWEQIGVIDQLFPLEVTDPQEMEKTTLKNLFWIGGRFTPSVIEEVKKITTYISQNHN